MSAPQIISLAQAGIPQAGGLSSWPTNEPEGNTVHWEGAGGHADHGYCIPEWHTIDAYHRSHGYLMIAYNWGVCNHGVVLEGRPTAYRSAAQNSGNSVRIAICYIGGPSFPFTDAAKASIGWLIRHAPGRAANKAIGHRDEPSCSTACPGDTVETWVKSGSWVGASAPSPHPAPSPPPLPLPSGGHRHPVLRMGNVGPAVMELQRKLIGGAGQRLVLDGQFGPKTRDAVLNLQRWCHLTVDGIVGPQTWATLDFAAASRGIH